MKRLTLVVLAALLVGCGLSPDSTPRDIPNADQKDLVEVVAGAAGAAGTGRVYLERTDETGRSLLSAVPRQFDQDPTSILRSLVTGPTEEEQRTGLRSAIPQGT